MFYQIGLLPVTNNLLDISSDIYMIIQGMIRSDRLKIPGSCVCELISFVSYTQQYFQTLLASKNPQARCVNRQTDRQRCIRAHRALILAQVGSKSEVIKSMKTCDTSAFTHLPHHIPSRPSSLETSDITSFQPVSHQLGLLGICLPLFPSETNL